MAYACATLTTIAICIASARGEDPSPKRPTSRVGESGVGKASRRIPEALNFANGLFRSRKFELAAEEYERFLASKPATDDERDARFGLANARLFQKRYQDAQIAFRKFLDDAPEHPRARSAWYRLGEVSYLLGDLADSRRALEKFTEGDPTHPNLETAWTYLGDVCFALKDLKGARAAYEKGLAAFPKGPLVDRTRYGLGRSLAGLDRPEEALKILDDLARSGGRDWVDRAWLQIGTIQLAAGKYDRAIAAFEALDRESPSSLLRPEAKLRRAEALIRSKRPEEAAPLLKSLAEEPAQPLGPQAALTLATLQLERDRNQEAADGLEAAIKRFPSSPLVPSLTFRLAESLVRLERPDDARARFLQVAEKSPGDPWAESAMLRGLRLAASARDFAAVRKVATSFKTAFPNSPSGPEIRLIEARALKADKHPEEAIPVFEMLIADAPGVDTKSPASAKLSAALMREARYELALAYQETGQKAKADALFAILAKDAPAPKVGDGQTLADPITADAQFLVGQAAVESGRFKEAIEPLQGYLNASPKGELADLALAHLATAQIGLGQIDAASKTLDRLADQFPKSTNLPPTRLRLAEAALLAKQYDLAAAQFGAIPASPEAKSQARIQTGLGQALWNLKKPAEAAAAFGQALDAAPDDPSSSEIAMARARALEAAGQVDRAIDAYAKLAARYETSGQAFPALVARARLQTKAGKSADALKSYQDLFADQARLDRAVAAGVAPDSLLSEWGWSLIDSGKTWESDPVFARLLKEFPDGAFAADARLNLAESANSAHNHAEIIRLLKPLADPGAKVSPAMMPDVLYRLGRTYIETGDWQAAAPVLDRLIRDFPDSPRRREARLFRAEVALQMNEAAGALSNLSALLPEVEGMSDSHSRQFRTLIRRRMIQCLLSLKRWDDVLTQADAIGTDLAKEDPARAELDFARGRAFQGLARMGEARDAYQAVIEARKGGDLAAQARFMRGETFFHEDKFGEARREFLMVDTLHDSPKWRAAALLEVGKIYERLGQQAEAANYFQMLIATFPAADPHVSEAKAHLQAALDRSKSPSLPNEEVKANGRKEDISARVSPE